MTIVAAATGPAASAAPLRGVLAAALTALGPDLEIDGPRTLAHYRRLLDEGCDGLAVFGTTGEANSFTVDERLGFLDRLGVAGLADRVLVGTGCCAQPDTVRLTRKALEIGAAGVLMLPPFYYKAVSDEGLYASFARVIETVGDAGLRVYLYHFPQMTGLDLPHGVIERLIGDFGPVVAGLKDSSGDWNNMKVLLDTFPGFDVFAGSEEFLLADLAHGGPGCISATVNLFAPQARNLALVASTCEAPALQERLTALRRVIQRRPAIPAMKAVMAERTGEAGWRAVRPPLVALSVEEGRAIVEELGAAGFEVAAAAA
jgi:4-hydroxy-tetrahydrodipicolinate synthase